MNKCMAAKPDDSISQVQSFGVVKASATLSDSRSDPFNVIDPEASGWWATPIGVKQAYWEVQFDRKYLVEQI